MKYLTSQEFFELKVGDTVLMTCRSNEIHVTVVGFEWDCGKCAGIKVLNHHNNTKVILITVEQIEEGSVKVRQPFKAMKFRVKDFEHSCKIQEYLFSIGYELPCSGVKISQDNLKFIYTELNGFILYGETEQVFEDSLENEETELVETVSYSLKTVDKEALRKHTQKEEIKKSIHEVEKQLSELREKLKSLEM
ncbi:MAG: hypothetical protein E6R13_01090 [Spirochaetes bacterium]|nr:MAG: hypothetical protein E6R13_01090 [Spirochaetota bacterium]